MAIATASRHRGLPMPTERSAPWGRTCNPSASAPPLPCPSCAGHNPRARPSVDRSGQRIHSESFVQTPPRTASLGHLVHYYYLNYSVPLILWIVIVFVPSSNLIIAEWIWMDFGTQLSHNLDWRREWFLSFYHKHFRAGSLRQVVGIYYTAIVQNWQHVKKSSYNKKKVL